MPALGRLFTEIAGIPAWKKNPSNHAEHETTYFLGSQKHTKRSEPTGRSLACWELQEQERCGLRKFSLIFSASQLVITTICISGQRGYKVASSNKFVGLRRTTIQAKGSHGRKESLITGETNI